jgi:ribonuclease J
MTASETPNATSRRGAASESPRSKTLKPVAAGTLRFVPLGGLGEIGMNMAYFEWEGKILIVDCGQTLPDSSMPGVDVVIPDASPLLERRRDIVGIVITHCHEDHIGALPYVLPRLEGVPVYAPRFARRLIESKLSELKPRPENKIITPQDNKPVELGPFKVSWIPVTHSTGDTRALAIETPLGPIIWSGDFKIDPNGVGSDYFDYQAFAKWGREGVLALFCDSTNAMVEGFAEHEVDLVGPLDHLFVEAAEGAIFFSTFSSAIYRVQTVVDLAAEHGRLIHVAGRSLGRAIDIGRDLRLLDIPDDILVDGKTFDKLPRSRRLALVSGCQGEPMAVMSRLSLGDYRKLEVAPGDTALLSARIIPGNEKAIFQMVNHLFRRGAKVYTQQDAKIHVSGHACRQEIKQFIALTRPKHMVPIHGELRHLCAMRDIAREMKLPEENIHLLDRGVSLEFTRKGAAIGGRMDVGRAMVDGRDLETLDDVVIRDRKHLAEDGVLIVIVAFEAESGEIAIGPDIAIRGFAKASGETEQIVAECKRITVETIKELDPETRAEAAVARDAIRRALRKHLSKAYDRHPLIIPAVVDM